MISITWYAIWNILMLYMMCHPVLSLDSHLNISTSNLHHALEVMVMYIGSGKLTSIDARISRWFDRFERALVACWRSSFFDNGKTKCSESLDWRRLAVFMPCLSDWQNRQALFFENVHYIVPPVIDQADVPRPIIIVGRGDLVSAGRDDARSDDIRHFVLQIFVMLGMYTLVDVPGEVRS